MRFRSAALCAALFLLSVAPALAAITGLVRGNVLVNGAPMAGVQITIRGEGSTLTTTTDEKGNFTVPQVTFGHYTVTAHSNGFTDTSQEINLYGGSVVTVNMQLGALKEIGHITARAGQGASGNPVGVNTLTKQTISALPGNTSLDNIVETVPGIVRFSYNEPVAHGFHGLTYEIDGMPIPQATSSNFSEIIDPRNIDSLEIYTAGFPAEYGGTRQGALVNIATNRLSELNAPPQGFLTIGGGNYAQATGSLSEQFKLGAARVFFNANASRNSRGIDAPTFDAIHDDSNLSDEILRVVQPLGKYDTLAFDYSNQFSQFQIPINTDPNNPSDPIVAVPGTDDVQREYYRFANLNFTMTSKDGSNVTQIIPWYRSIRVAYLGDLPNDVLGYGPNPSYDPSQPTSPTNEPTIPNIGLQQDQLANYVGVRVSTLHADQHHAVKVGVDLDRENYSNNSTYAQFGLPNVFTFVGQAGANVGVYAQDKWSPSRAVTVNYGVRYDHSTGFVSGNALSPRIGVNFAPDQKNVLHLYYGRLYAAPALEDTRPDCIALQGCTPPLVYDLKPETDSIYELGVDHAFSPTMSGYVDMWGRSVTNVLDTQQLLNTPLFAVFNNLVGRAQGLEVRLQGRQQFDEWFVSGTMSQSLAGGVSGSTFLFCPTQSFDCLNQIGNPYPLQPEDHDQTYAVNAAYTHRWGDQHTWFATLGEDYGTGYPTLFQNGPGRLPAHWILNMNVGKSATSSPHQSIGFNLDVQNILDHQYIIKISNGFNTTQIFTGRNVVLYLTAPLH